MSYWLAFLLAGGLSFGLTPLAKWLSFKLGGVDEPDKQRKFHQGRVARMGGLAVAVSFLGVTALSGLHFSRALSALLLGLVIVLAVGLVDDMRGLSPGVRLTWQFVAAMIALAGGIGIVSIANPFGGLIWLDIGRFTVSLGPLHFHILPLANVLSLLWMVGMVNTVNLLDGLDGLATGVVAIAALVMFLLAISPLVNQPDVALLAIILVGACVGFLPFNSHPAKIFLGDGGAYFLGLLLALLAIYSGAKLATAVLVLGFTIIDSTWVVLRRIRAGGSPFKADRQHFHHRLLEVGFTQRQAVWLLYGLTVLMGLVALASGTLVKLVAIILLIVMMSVALASLSRRAKRS